MPLMVKFHNLLKSMMIFCSAHKNNRDFIKNLLLNYAIIKKFRTVSGQSL